MVACGTAHRMFGFDVRGSLPSRMRDRILQCRMVELCAAMFATDFAGSSHNVSCWMVVLMMQNNTARVTTFDTDCVMVIIFYRGPPRPEWCMREVGLA